MAAKLGCLWSSNLFVDRYFDRGSGTAGAEAAVGGVNGGGKMYVVKVLRVSGGLGSRNPALDPYQQVSRVNDCLFKT